MSSEPQLARLAAKIVVNEELPSFSPRAEDRVRAVQRIARALRAKARARYRRTWMVRSAAIAATFALAIGAASVVRGGGGNAAVPGTQERSLSASVQGELRVDHAGESRRTSGGVTLVAGDRVFAAAESPSSLVLRSGTRLVLQPGSDLAVLEHGPTQAFALGAGSVRADVTKVGAGERFLVRTIDAEVEVWGTSFVVESVASDPQCGGGTRTRIRVDEGVVSVRALGVEYRVLAGQKWPASCESPGPGPSAIPSAEEMRSPVKEPPQAGRPAAVTAGVPGRSPVASPAADDTKDRPNLRTQNTLFADALAAKRRGDTQAALKAVDELLEHYPSGPLAENALAERMRLKTGVGAVEAAREYRMRYPNGFARSEAEGIAGP